MTVFVDTRDGSRNLVSLFTDALLVDNLEADIVFNGIGPEGAEYVIGVEFKKVPDLLKCIVDGRFAGGQLITMDEHLNDYWLLIEGGIKRGRKDELLIESGRGNWYHAHVGNRYFNYDDLSKWKITLASKAGLKIEHVNSRIESRDWINVLYNWWEEGWDRHKAANATNHSKPHVYLQRPTLARLVAEQLPGIGYEKAIRVSQRFKTVFDIAIGTEEDWMEVEGVGKKMAERIVKAINEP